MYLLQAIKLAWANTTNQWRRLLVRCAGITFAVVLMFMQTGFRNALFDSNVRLAERMDADFVIRTKTRFMLSSGQTMLRDYIVKSRGVSGVAEAKPVYIEAVASYFRIPGKPARRVRVIAFDLSSPIFTPLGVGSFAQQLAMPETGIIDRKSKPIYHVDPYLSGNGDPPVGELINKKIQLVGRFDLGIDFTNDGNMIMSPQNFAHYFSHRGRGQPLTRPDYGVVKCEPGADLDQVLIDLKKTLGPHVIINTRQGFLNSERAFWGKSTPVGLIFMVGTIIGFVVGLIICYQVLATDISDHMSEFATIKAMGYPVYFFAAVVVCQALFLSLFSFLPGLVIASTAFWFVNVSTGLLMYLNFYRAGIVLLLTIVMCVLSGIVALQKLLSTDPASLF